MVASDSDVSVVVHSRVCTSWPGRSRGPAWHILDQTPLLYLAAYYGLARINMKRQVPPQVTTQTRLTAASNRLLPEYHKLWCGFNSYLQAMPSGIVYLLRCSAHGQLLPCTLYMFRAPARKGTGHPLYQHEVILQYLLSIAQACIACDTMYSQREPVPCGPLQ